MPPRVIRMTAQISPILPIRKGLALTILQLDVTDTEAIKSAVEQVIDNSGRIDVLINNAGVARLATLEDLPEVDIDHVMKVNFIAPVLLSKAVLPTMRTQGYGRIIMMSSLSALGRIARRGYLQCKQGGSGSHGRGTAL